MSLATNISDLATSVATEIKKDRVKINGNAPDLSALTTTDKSNLVAAINEIANAIGGAGATIDDDVASLLTVWSSSKTDSEINSRIADILDSAPEALNTLNELAAALADDPSFATTINNSLSLKAPIDSPTFTGTPNVPTASETTNSTQAASTAFVRSVVGDPNTDFVATFEAGLVS